MQTGDSSQETPASRKRRGARYDTQTPVPAPSTDGNQTIPVPLAIQAARQVTGAQPPVAAGNASARNRRAPDKTGPVPTPAANFDPERPRRQTGVQPAVAPLTQPEPAPKKAAKKSGAKKTAPKKAAPVPQTASVPQGMAAPQGTPVRQAQGIPTPQEAQGSRPVRGYQTGKQTLPPMPAGMPVHGFQTGTQQPVMPPMPVQQPAPGYVPQQMGYPQQPVGYQPQQGWQQPVPQQGFGQGNGYQPPMQQGYVPPVPPKPPVSMTPPVPPKKRGGSGNGRGGKRMLWIALAAILVAAVVAAVAIIVPQKQHEQYVANAVNSYNDRYCEGVYVDGIHLGGMTQAEAADAVIRQAQQRSGSWSVRLMYNGQLVREINASMLGMTVDVEDTLATAWAQGHTGTTEERYDAMANLQQTPFHAYTAQPSGDASVIDTVLEEIRLQVYRAPQDAAIVAFNPDATDPFTISDAVPGRMLDVAPIKTQAYEMLSTMTSGDIELVPTYIEPSVTAADLRKTVTLRGTAYTEISTTSTEDRTNNIRRAFASCSGVILAPGDTFSFNGRVGERTTDNGFFHAPEYVYDELTDGVGGGVCQASTTIMQAALKAGLTVTDHTPHSEKANYAEYGMDATVYWMYNRRIDFKFKNTTDSNIYIVCSVQSNPNNRKRYIAKCDIYGADLEGTSYELVSEMVEEIPFEQKTVRDKDKKYVQYTDETQVVTTGRIGYVYNTYRITKVNGVEVSKDFLFDSTYKKRDEVTYVGTSTRP